MQNPDSEVPAATVKQSGGVSSHTHTHICVCVCVSGTSASVGMAGCLSVSLPRGDQGHSKLAH